MKATQAEIFDLPFTSNAFREAWDHWIQYRKERKLSKYVPTGLKMTFSKLLKDCSSKEERAIEIIHNAISCNWQGLYPNKTEAIKEETKIHRAPQFAQLGNRDKPKEMRDFTDTEMMEWIQEYKDKKEVNVFYLPVVIYDFLKKKGMFVLTEDQRNWCLRKAIPFRKQMIQEEIQGNRLPSDYLKKFHMMEETGEFTGIEPAQIEILAKKVALSQYFKKTKDEIQPNHTV